MMMVEHHATLDRHLDLDRGHDDEGEDDDRDESDDDVSNHFGSSIPRAPTFLQDPRSNDLLGKTSPTLDALLRLRPMGAEPFVGPL